MRANKRIIMLTTDGDGSRKACGRKGTELELVLSSDGAWRRIGNSRAVQRELFNGTDFPANLGQYIHVG